MILASAGVLIEGCRRKQKMITAASMDRVVDQWLAVAVQCDSPDDAIKFTAEQIGRAALRALAKPDGIDELQMDLAVDNRVAQSRKHGRLLRRN